MRERPLGITALSVLSVMVGIYSFMGALALLIGGSIGTFAGADIGPLVMVLGSAFLGLSVAAYLVGGGLWLQRRWSWAGAVVVFGTVIVLNLGLSLLASNLISSILPMVGAAAAIWYLARPGTKAQLMSTSTSEATDAATEPLQGDVASAAKTA